MYQPSREFVEVFRWGEPARILLLKCLGLGKEGKDIKKGVCLYIRHFCLFVFVQNVMCRCVMCRFIWTQLFCAILCYYA
jgi:hypothetical protein